MKVQAFVDQLEQHEMSDKKHNRDLMITDSVDDEVRFGDDLVFHDQANQSP
jgi:hypothetical protein